MPFTLKTDTTQPLPVSIPAIISWVIQNRGCA